MLFHIECEFTHTHAHKLLCAATVCYITLTFILIEKQVLNTHFFSVCSNPK
jgi:hypothetical protein